jgi:hypothetical protein
MWFAPSSLKMMQVMIASTFSNSSTFRKVHTILVMCM